jgi:hypothetical protein
MSRAVNRCYINPITSAGVPVVGTSDPSFLNGRGVFTLAAGTYYFVLPVGQAAICDVHLTHDAAMAITSATIETCSHGRSEVTDYSTIAGEWMDQDPSTAFVALKGANTTHTNGVVAVTAGAAGGASWQISGIGADRMRLAVVVGTQGEARLSFSGKD